MGTRADFYVGIGADAEWLGSVAWDGYPDGPWAEITLSNPSPVPNSPMSEGTFRANIERVLSQSASATRPAQGWPWPWETSGTTDFAYWFNPKTGAVECSCFSHLHDIKAWEAYNEECRRLAREYDDPEYPEEPSGEWPHEMPDMSAVQSVAYDSDRSGVIFVSR